MKITPKIALSMTYETESMITPIIGGITHSDGKLLLRVSNKCG